MGEGEEVSAVGGGAEGGGGDDADAGADGETVRGEEEGEGAEG